jgi:hypothetical protein
MASFGNLTDATALANKRNNLLTKRVGKRAHDERKEKEMGKGPRIKNKGL